MRLWLVWVQRISRVRGSATALGVWPAVRNRRLLTLPALPHSPLDRRGRIPTLGYLCRIAQQLRHGSARHVGFVHSSESQRDQKPLADRECEASGIGLGPNWRLGDPGNLHDKGSTMLQPRRRWGSMTTRPTTRTHGRPRTTDTRAPSVNEIEQTRLAAGQRRWPLGPAAIRPAAAAWTPDPELKRCNLHRRIDVADQDAARARVLVTRDQERMNLLADEVADKHPRRRRRGNGEGAGSSGHNAGSRAKPVGGQVGASSIIAGAKREPPPRRPGAAGISIIEGRFQAA